MNAFESAVNPLWSAAICKTCWLAVTSLRPGSAEEARPEPPSLPMSRRASRRLWTTSSEQDARCDAAIVRRAAPERRRARDLGARPFERAPRPRGRAPARFGAGELSGLARPLAVSPLLARPALPARA